MALANCRECGKKVSTEAEACPDCGAPNPTAGASQSNEVRAPEGEPLEYASRPTWRSQLRWVVVAAALLIIPLFLPSESGGGAAQASAQLSPLVPLFILSAFVVACLPLYNRYKQRFVIDDPEIRSRQGLLSRNTQSINIGDVRNIDVKQNVEERLLGIGDVHFSSSADAGTEVSFHGIGDPVGVKERVQNRRGRI